MLNGNNRAAVIVSLTLGGITTLVSSSQHQMHLTYLLF